MSVSAHATDKYEMRGCDPMCAHTRYFIGNVMVPSDVFAGSHDFTIEVFDPLCQGFRRGGVRDDVSSL